MKYLTKFSVLLLAAFVVALCLFASPAKANAASGYYAYFVSNGEATITGVDPSLSGKITIPSTLGGYPVTIIGYMAFSDCTNLTSINVPDSVTSIGANAFYSCDNLASVTIPDSVTSIGDYAFFDCTSLTSLTIGDGVTSIGEYAFSDCTSLTSITIPNSVTSIGNYAFSNCTSLTSITIPNSVTSIGNYAFNNCSSLTGVTIGDSITSVGDSAFSNCTSLTSVSISDISAWCKISFSNSYSNPLRYAKNLYLNGELVTDLEIPADITSIGYYAFYNCSSLTSVIIPDSVTSICSSAFSGCSGLTEMTIPFVGGSRKTAADTHQQPFGYIFGTTRYTGGKATTQYYYGSSTISTINITYYIPSSLKSVTVTGGDILYGAFYNCSSLTSITIPDSITSIGSYAFYKCSSLSSIAIPDSVTSVGRYAFYNCSSLFSIAIPDSVTSIGDDAFYYCNSLKHVAYAGTYSQWIQISIGGDNTKLTGATRHYNAKETDVYWTKNCVNVGLFCPICNIFVSKENPEDGSHSYSDISDISCNDCDFVQRVSSVSVYQKPSDFEYELYTGTLNVEDGILQVHYNDGGLTKVEMTLEMVSGFDNTKIGSQTLTVTYEGKSATYTVEIVPGTPNSVQILTMPQNLNYITGAKLDFTGLSLMACYPGNLSAEVPFADITVDSVDMSTPGIKTVKVGYKGIYTSLLIYVHTKQTVTLDSSTYPESSHNYASSTNESKTFTYPGTGSLILTFNASSYTESNYDWVYLYDGAGNQVGKYSGSLAGKVVTIPGDTFTIKLTSDSSVNKYGYAFSSIVAETILHTYENNTCTVCGNMESYSWTMMADATVHISLMEDLYIDLNGYNLSGTIVTNGYKVYGMDSTTSRYTCDNMGTFNCVDESGDAIVPESLYTTEDMMRYMTIKTENGYTFHRFYLGITNVSLAPSVTGFGYKAEFYGDEMVQQQITGVGYNLWLTEDRVVSRTTAFKNVLTLRLQNFDVMNFGEIPVNACATITFMDGTVITGTIHSHTLRQMVEDINSAYTNYNTTQLTALHTMIQNNPAMQAWQVENIYKKDTV